MRRVTSVSSPRLILLLVVLSVGLSAIAVPYYETIIVIPSAFFIYNSDEVMFICCSSAAASNWLARVKLV